MSSLPERILDWDRVASSLPLDESTFSDLLQYIMFRSQSAFSEYQPTYTERIEFLERLKQWLDNCSKIEEQQVLFKLLTDILFFGREEFDSLCESAYNGIIVPWLIDNCEINIFDSQAGSKILKSAEESWFCAITDSMPIAHFCHINKITGCSYRLCWRDAAYFGIPLENIKSHLKEQNYQRIIILEDFVGSGTQVTRRPREGFPSILNILDSLASDYPVLLIALVACPDGLKKISDTIQRLTNSENINIKPVFTLDEGHFVRKEYGSNNKDYRDRLSPKYKGTLISMLKRLESEAENDVEWPYGFKNMGALFVMYSNCPNNTLALIHQDRENAPEWKSLFPRISRT